MIISEGLERTIKWEKKERRMRSVPLSLLKDSEARGATTKEARINTPN